MVKLTSWILILGLTLLSALYAAPAQAQATRTWVSGVGDDANPCSRTAPCKTFAGAISKTAVSGEINCLDPGGFGAVTITKSIVFDCHEVFGSVLVAGTNGIIINAIGGNVTLRNININGAGGSGLSGINILGASKVFIEDVMVMGFSQYGVIDSRTEGGTRLIIRNSTFRNNGISGIGLAASYPNSVSLEKVHSVGNAYGVSAGGGNFAVISNSVMSDNANSGLHAEGSSIFFISRTQVAQNGYGLEGGGTFAINDSDIVFNTTGISGPSTSFGDNRIYGNASPGNAPTVQGLQ